MTEERLAELMVKAADGLANPTEMAELMAYVEDHPALEDELRAHSSLGETTQAWTQRLALDPVEDAWANSTATRLERGVGVVLLLGGVGVLGTFGGLTLWLDPATPFWVKLGSAMLIGGALVLLGSVVRWKWRTAKDPYSKVVR